MKEGQLNQLEKERSLGSVKQQAFDTHVEPFLTAKRLDLFNAFCKVPSTDVEGLQSIRMQITAIDSIEADFQRYIDTGKMAAHTLEQEGE